MFRSNTSGSKIIDNKLADKTYALHLKRLNKIKRSSSQTLQLQNNNSELIKNASYLRNNDKKKELQKELQNLKIDKDNKILLTKMTQIVKNPVLRNTFYNFQNIQQTTEAKSKSMNAHVRKQEIEKIVAENPGIVHRIRQQTSFYDVKKWEKEFKARETYIKNLCEFPQTDAHSSSLEKTPRLSVQVRGNMSPTKPVTNRQLKPPSLHRRSLSSDMSSSSKSLLTEGKITKASRKLILYKKESEINKCFYLVEFAVCDKKFQITLSTPEEAEPRCILLDDDKGKQLLIENSNSYDRIISKIYFKDNRVYIRGFYEEDVIRTDAKIELFNSLTGRRTSSPDTTKSQSENL